MFEQTGTNPGQTTVRIVVPAASVSATVSIFDWNALSTSLIYEVIDTQGTPTGQVLQRNPAQMRIQISNDLANLQGTIATIADEGLRNSLRVKVENAQDLFVRGQTKPAANNLRAMRNEVEAQIGKNLSASAAATLRQLSADALVLLAAS
jgi:hypothetical protein